VPNFIIAELVMRWKITSNLLKLTLLRQDLQPPCKVRIPVTMNSKRLLIVRLFCLMSWVPVKYFSCEVQCLLKTACSIGFRHDQIHFVSALLLIIYSLFADLGL